MKIKLLYVSFILLIFSLNSFFKKEICHYHFHSYDQSLSPYFIEQLKKNKNNENKNIFKKIKKFVIKYFLYGISGFVLYKIYKKYQINKKIYEIIKLIMIENNDIESIIKKNYTLFENLNDNFFIPLYYFFNSAFSRKNNAHENKEKRTVIKEIFEIIKKDYRFEDIITIVRLESISKNKLFEMIEKIIIYDYTLI